MTVSPHRALFHFSFLPVRNLIMKWIKLRIKTLLSHVTPPTLQKVYGKA